MSCLICCAYALLYVSPWESGKRPIDSFVCLTCEEFDNKATTTTTTTIGIWRPIWSRTSSGLTLTRLRAARLRSEVRQVHVGLPAVDDGVGVFARPLRCSPVHHGHLQTAPRIHNHSWGATSSHANAPIPTRWSIVRDPPPPLRKPLSSSLYSIDYNRVAQCVRRHRLVETDIIFEPMFPVWGGRFVFFPTPHTVFSRMRYWNLPWGSLLRSGQIAVGRGCWRLTHTHTHTHI